jgi:hypothetical protein
MIRATNSILVCLLSIFTILVVPVYAISDDFTIGVTIGSDSTPPTIPAPVLATPVASTQIDIVWGASVDDQSLSGYRLFRDAVQIATTSLLTYSDTGLTASTTYTYTVEAYDWMMNISTTSALSATTTLQAPVVATSTPSSSGGTQLEVRLIDLEIDPAQTSAEISWSTNINAKYALRWGKVTAYDLGFVQNETFKRTHNTLIDDLEPGTKYVYELIAYSPQGREYVLSEGSFITASAPDNDSPANVWNLQAVVEGDSVRLSWTNPTDEDFTKVRIVRNYNFYPGDTSAGFIVYEGSGESVYDTQALRLYNDQYYTIFSYDEHGNISSGAVIRVQKVRPQNGVEDIATIDYHASQTVSTSTQKGSLISIGYLDVDILQDNILLAPVKNVVHVNDHSPVVFQIPYEVLPEHLKTIIMTVDDDVSYMLRINTSKSVYQAVLPRFVVLGSHTLSFKIYDYQTQLLTTFEGELYVNRVAITEQITQKQLQRDFQFYAIRVGSFFLFLIMLLMIYFAFIRRRSE